MKKTYLTLLMAGTFALGSIVSVQAGTLGVNTGVNAGVNTGAVNARVDTGTNASARTYNNMETSSGSRYDSTNEVDADIRSQNRVNSNSDFNSDLDIRTNSRTELGSDAGFGIYSFND